MNSFEFDSFNIKYRSLFIAPYINIFRNGRFITNINQHYYMKAAYIEQILYGDIRFPAVLYARAYLPI